MNTTCAFSATRLAVWRSASSAFRCTTEVSQRARTTSPTALLRVSRTSTQSRRQYGAPAYQSYTLPTNSGPLPTRVDTLETPLPKVNETRPPKQTFTPSTSQQTQPDSIEASTTLEKPETPATPSPAPSASTTAAAAPASTTAPATKRPRSKLRARKAAMKLTPAAVEQLQMMLDSPEPKLIKVGVRNRGCSGLAYHLAWVDKPGPFDEEVVQDGVRVLIDSKALFSIIGSEMDWVEDKLSQKFVFKNPNISE